MNLKTMMIPLIFTVLVLLFERVSSQVFVRCEPEARFVCAGTRIECECNVSVIVMEWEVEGRNDPISFEFFNGSPLSYSEGGFNATFDEENLTSRLSFFLETGESLNITCENGNYSNPRSERIFEVLVADPGLPEAPDTLNVSFGEFTISLMWHHNNENNCTREYLVSINEKMTKTRIKSDKIQEAPYILSADQLSSNQNAVYYFTINAIDNVGREGETSENSSCFSTGIPKLDPDDDIVIVINETDKCELILNLTKPFRVITDDIIRPEITQYIIRYIANGSTTNYSITPGQQQIWNITVQPNAFVHELTLLLQNNFGGNSTVALINGDEICNITVNDTSGDTKTESNDIDAAFIVVAVVVSVVVICIIGISISCIIYRDKSSCIHKCLFNIHSQVKAK